MVIRRKHMRRYMALVVGCLVMTGVSCNLGTRATPTPSPAPAPEIAETELPPIEAASTALAQYGATLTAQAPPSTPTPDSGVICLLAFEDLNGNTVHDESEGVLQDVRFVLQHDAAEVEALYRSSEGGPFCLAELPPGDYVIQAFPPISFGATPSGEMSIRLAAGETVQVALGFVESSRPDGRLELDGRHPAAILASDTRGDTLYLAAAQTLYRSEDGGQSWESVGEQPPGPSMVASPAEPSILYAGRDLDCFRGGPPAPLYISQDGGASWTESADGTGLCPATAHPLDPAIAWAIGCDGPYMTEDGGLTWQHQPADAWGLYTLDEIRPVDTQPRTLYATGNSEGGSGALFRSQDGGHTWRLVTDEPELWISALLLRPDAPDEVWFATPTGVWHSLDGGDTWEIARAGLEEVAVGDDYLFENRGLHALARDASGALYLGTEQGIFQSGDGGLNWRPLSGPPWTHEPISQVIVTDAWSDTRLWVTAASGVYLYTPQVP
jgi:photosystem II stability/assembly factor-like uncharacterized protein